MLLLLIPGAVLGRGAGNPVADDPQGAVALRYAPFIYHATDSRGGRQDFISSIDFDGDLIGNNNWENFDHFPLIPTVYFAVLETSSHYFLSYHLFHPRDWNHFTFWLHDTHENDGENLQIVVRKKDGRVVLLWTQAHYKSEVYVRDWSGIRSSVAKVVAPFQLVNEQGIPSDTGRHAAVFVESQGHGIYGTLSPHSEVALKNDGTFLFEGKCGVLFRPARENEQVIEPVESRSGTYPYNLVSITTTLYPLLRDGSLTGDGKLLDGSYRYKDDLVDIPEVPRYYDANRFSGPFGPDRGISPFALDFIFEEGTLGALFFNPAARYPEQLHISDPWSRDYVDYPFR